VERSDATQKFHLGTKLIELGNRAQHELDIYRIAHPYLDALNREVDETVHLTVLDVDEALYVDCIESRKRLRTYSVIGVRGPLHATSVGKAMLAFLPEDQIRHIVHTKGLSRFTSNTITDEQELFSELARVRRQGYAVDNAEHEDHLRCIGAPIRDAEGAVIASISISGPSQRITGESVPALAPAVIRAADGVSAKLGYDGAAPARDRTEENGIGASGAAERGATGTRSTTGEAGAKGGGGPEGASFPSTTFESTTFEG
jgi:DNA-binding IclR family transcriptional regulator